MDFKMNDLHSVNSDLSLTNSAFSNVAKTSDNLKNLPVIFDKKIFEYLHFFDLTALASVNHATKQSSEDSKLWSKLCTDFKFEIKEDISAKTSFRLAFKQDRAIQTARALESLAWSLRSLGECE